MKLKKLRKLAAIALAVGVLLAGCGTESTPKESKATTDNTTKKIVIGYVDSGKGFPNEVLAVAIDQGFLKEEFDAIGYEVETVPSTGAGPAINEGMVNGSIDAATTGDVPAIIGKSSGMDTTLLAGEIKINDAAIIVPADSDIKSVADLKGKTVATLQGSYMHKSLIDILEGNGLSVGDIQFTNMTGADIIPAVENGSVQAACIANIQECLIVKNDKIRILQNCDGHDEWKGGHAVIIRSDYLKENREAGVALVRALVRANNYAKENRDSALSSIEKSGFTKEQAEFLFPGEVDFHVNADEEAIQVYKDIKKFLLDNKLSTKDFDVASWLDESIYKEAVEGL